MIVDLVFTSPAAPVSGPAPVVDLVFGATGGTPATGPVSVTVSVVLPLPTLTLLARYDPRLVRRFVGTQATAAHGVADARRAHIDAAFRRALPGKADPAVGWTAGQPRCVLAASAHAVAARVHRTGAVRWGDAQRMHASVGVPHETAQAVAQASICGWSLAQGVSVQVAVVGEVAAELANTAASGWRVGTGLCVMREGRFHAARHRTGLHMHAAVWQVASRQRNGLRDAVSPPQPPVSTTVALVFMCPIKPGTALIFGVHPCPGSQPAAGLFIPIARYYMAVHNLEAHLLPGLTPIPIYDVSLQGDSSSFAWTFSATGPADLFDALAPSGGLPPSLRITIDGLQWVFVADSLQRQEQFGQRGTRIAGRSATALVGSPYSREAARLSTTARNAQQLAAAALDLTGVALDWGISDWLVPAGAWSHTGTPLAAVQAIAEAAGGYVNSHRSDPTLLVRHPYPTLPGGVPGGPWNWAGLSAADVELAPSAIITSSIERRDGPDVDGIYVSGTSQGVLAHVKRTGTAGAKLASMVTDPLMTANIAAQQRGLAALGAAGAKHLVQISLPVLTGGSNPGVLDVGQLVQINDSVPWRARVRAVVVLAKMPKVRQSITLERHLA